jgi:hypothetical protein
MVGKAERRAVMNVLNEELSFADAFCAGYERLLNECQQALFAWSERSEKVRQSRLIGERIGRELLGLQVRFAKCYTDLQKHTGTCQRCLAVSRINQFIVESKHHDVRLSVC